MANPFLNVYICGGVWYTLYNKCTNTACVSGKAGDFVDTDSTWTQINLDAISRNFAAIRRKAGVGVMAVVKADAYGHGAVAVARWLEGSCAFFGVSSVQEALELRQGGLQKPILILGYTPPGAFPVLLREGIRPTIFREEDARALSQAAQAAGITARFHIAVDTGMSRIGFQVCPEDAECCTRIAALPGLAVEGLFSHLATADCAELDRAREQARRFEAFDAMLKERGLRIPIRHLDNSAGLMNFDRHYEMVRSGIVTYGLYPSREIRQELLPLEPALQWFSRVTHVKILPPGREISYGGDYVTRKPTTVATVSVGYADGYRRSLSGRFYVLIRGQRAPILGRVCMDQMMVDVTCIPGVCPGDRVTLIGRDGSETITMEDIAARADSFPYEFSCGISRRVPRRYASGGKTVHSVHYLLYQEDPQWTKNAPNTVTPA